MRPKHVSRQVGGRQGDKGHLVTLSPCHLAILLFVSLSICFLASCASTAPTFKIGLAAPFEGRYRPIGYDAIYAARLAVRQANARGGVGGYRVELLAFDDGGDPDTASRQAGMLALDPAVVGVIGHFRADTTQAAIPVYSREGVPLLVPANVPASLAATAIFLGPTTEQLDAALQTATRSIDHARVMPDADAIQAGEFLQSWDGVLAGGPDLALADFARIAGPKVEGTIFVTGAPWPQDVAGSEQFIADYKVVSGGTLPGPYAWAAYQAMRALLDAAQRDIQANGRPSRDGVKEQLHAALDGKTAPVYLYRYDAAGQPVQVP
jgi:ABC-type branched-subunit amino acid transport system substrate-binding protein